MALAETPFTPVVLNSLTVSGDLTGTGAIDDAGVFVLTVAVDANLTAGLEAKRAEVETNAQQVAADTLTVTTKAAEVAADRLTVTGARDTVLASAATVNTQAGEVAATFAQIGPIAAAVEADRIATENAKVAALNEINAKNDEIQAAATQVTADRVQIQVAQAAVEEATAPLRDITGVSTTTVILGTGGAQNWDGTTTVGVDGNDPGFFVASGQTGASARLIVTFTITEAQAVEWAGQRILLYRNALTSADLLTVLSGRLDIRTKQVNGATVTTNVDEADQLISAASSTTAEIGIYHTVAASDRTIRYDFQITGNTAVPSDVHIFLTDSLIRLETAQTITDLVEQEVEALALLDDTLQLVSAVEPWWAIAFNANPLGASETFDGTRVTVRDSVTTKEGLFFGAGLAGETAAIQIRYYFTEAEAAELAGQTVTLRAFLTTTPGFEVEFTNGGTLDWVITLKQLNNDNSTNVSGNPLAGSTVTVATDTMLIAEITHTISASDRIVRYDLRNNASEAVAADASIVGVAGEIQRERPKSVAVSTAEGVAAAAEGLKRETHAFIVAGQSNATSYAVFDGGQDWPVGAYQWGRFFGDDARVVAAKRPLQHHTQPEPGGFGWALQFVVDYMAANPGVDVLLIPAAHGGTGFAAGDWNPGDELFYDMVKRTNAALASSDLIVLKGLLWHQGESDIAPGDAQNWAAAFDAMATQARADITGGANMKIVVGQIGIQDGVQDSTVVRAAIADTPNRLANVGFADSAGLTTTDGTHFNAASFRTLGSRYYTAWAAL